jgi:hypothetical protein
MILRDPKRVWRLCFLVLLVVLPGFPILGIGIAILFSLVGLGGLLFTPALILHNLYYKLPAVLFGDALYPVESFGYLPTAGGYAVAALLYAVIAFASSFALTALIRSIGDKQGKADD